jgi:hypothetical protein
LITGGFFGDRGAFCGLCFGIREALTPPGIGVGFGGVTGAGDVGFVGVGCGGTEVDLIDQISRLSSSKKGSGIKKKSKYMHLW